MRAGRSGVSVCRRVGRKVHVPVHSQCTLAECAGAARRIRPDRMDQSEDSAGRRLLGLVCNMAPVRLLFRGRVASSLALSPPTTPREPTLRAGPTALDPVDGSLIHSFNHSLARSLVCHLPPAHSALRIA
ncbi:unnamed protein product, partial [Protopolystoma xenopodis]